jgi:hypothetical protein
VKVSVQKLAWMNSSLHGQEFLAQSPKGNHRQ